MPMFNFGGQAQLPQQAQPQGGGFLQQLLAPENAMPIAAALMGQQGNGQNFSNAMSAYGQTAAQTAGKNRTLDFFRKNAPEYADMVQAGMPLNEAWQQYTQQRYAKPAANPFGDRAAAAQQYGLDPNSEEGRAFILSGDLPSARGGASETGLVPQMMRDPKTNKTIFVQPTKDGRLIPSNVPDGYEPYDPYTRAAQTSAGGAAGKGQGEATVAYRSMMSKLPGLQTVVNDLNDLADKATYTGAGQIYDYGRAQLGMEPREAAIARTDYIAKVDNQILPLLRDTFGAAFTVKEGEALRATLGDPDKTPAEKKRVLKAFIEQKQRDVESLALQSAGYEGGATQQGPQGSGGNRTQSGVSWTVEP